MWSFPLKTLTSLEVAEKFKILFDSDNIPKLLQTDNGTEFKGEVTKLLSSYEIKHIRSKPNSPQTQGMVENSNKYLKVFLNLIYSTRSNKVFELEYHVREIVFGYNERTHSVTTYKPEELYNRGNKIMYENALKKIDAYYNKRIEKNFKNLSVGTKIALKNCMEIYKTIFLRPKKQIKKNNNNMFHSVGDVIEPGEFGVAKISIHLSSQIMIGSYFINYEHLYVLTDSEYDAYSKNISRIVFK